MSDGELRLEVVGVDKPADSNVIIGQSHFVKTVEDVHEALVGASPHLRFGIAFDEASGDRLVRRSGNDAESSTSPPAPRSRSAPATCSSSCCARATPSTC